MRVVLAWVLAVVMTVICYILHIVSNLIYDRLYSSGLLNATGVIGTEANTAIGYVGTGIHYLFLFVAGAFWLYAIAIAFRREEEVYYEE